MRTNETSVVLDDATKPAVSEDQPKPRSPRVIPKGSPEPEGIERVTDEDGFAWKRAGRANPSQHYWRLAGLGVMGNLVLWTRLNRRPLTEVLSAPSISKADRCSGCGEPARGPHMRGCTIIALVAELREAIGDELQSAEPANFEEDNYDAGYIAGLTFAQDQLRKRIAELKSGVDVPAESAEPQRQAPDGDRACPCAATDPCRCTGAVPIKDCGCYRYTLEPQHWGSYPYPTAEDQPKPRDWVEGDRVLWTSQGIRHAGTVDVRDILHLRVQEDDGPTWLLAPEDVTSLSEVSG